MWLLVPGFWCRPGRVGGALGGGLWWLSAKVLPKDMLGRGITGLRDARMRPRLCFLSCREQGSYLQNTRLLGLSQELASNSDTLHLFM